MANRKPRTPKTKPLRRLTASRVRNRATRRAFGRRHPDHKNNGEEDDKSLNQFNSFRKGLIHDKDGLVKASDYKKFKEACEDQELKKFEKVKIGTAATSFRKWESPTAGAIYELEGADAQAVTMPPAPQLDSDELAAEMAEVYLMALLRDVPFTDYNSDSRIVAAADALDSMPWFHSAKGRGKVTKQNLFRGEGTGVHDGHLLSQFLLVGTPDITVSKKGAQAKGINSDPEGLIEFGAQRIDQRVRAALPGLDFMQNLKSWLKVQRGSDIPNIDPMHFVKEGSTSPPDRRFIATGRDLATYVHFDALYQAYLNACLILLASDAKFQPGFPHQGAKHTKGFAQFGGPHILTLVTEVATRALKAVRYQKFTNHRRARPEQLAGLISQFKKFEHATKNPFAAMAPLVRRLDTVHYQGKPLLEAVDHHNKGQGYFLPMAFPEGSPMHPAYGAGHATVAGACVTILKSFFHTEGVKVKTAYVPDKSSGFKKLIRKTPNRPLTVEGELNKLAANISIGRNIGGVHYYTDYSESLKMGEQIAHNILDEQMYTYPEDVEVEVPYFFKSGSKEIRNF